MRTVFITTPIILFLPWFLLRIKLVYKLYFYVLFPGCDTTCDFFGKGKAKRFSVLEKHPKFVEMFQNFGTEFDVSEAQLNEIEKFVCWLYNQTNTDKVYKARYEILKIGKFNEDSMPCTLDVLEKHTKHAFGKEHSIQ